MIGDVLLRLCRQATRELTLIAPFIKADVLGRLLEEVAPGVAITCVTRWRAQEIVIGVSDLEVWDVIRAHANARMLLRYDLHAKLFRGDELALVGSANLTATALGWMPRPNLELLVEIDPGAVRVFEDQVIVESIEVDDAIRASVEDAVTALRASRDWQQDYRSEGVSCSESNRDTGSWLPTCRRPDKLFSAYSGNEGELVHEAYEAAVRDLAVFDLPPRLPRRSFELMVATTLQQMPLLKKIDALLKEPQSFNTLTELLREEADGSTLADMSEIWVTLARWLVYFLPGKYQTITRHEELFQRVPTA